MLEAVLGRATTHTYYLIRYSPLPDATKKPGPGAHSPEKGARHLKTAPSYSMGVRHSEYMCPLIIDVTD